MDKIDNILAFNFEEVISHCPHNRNIHKCADIFSSPDKYCLSTLCSRKQAHYYNLLSMQLQAENEKLKKQYNCYACGNCNGKEDYRNLERHHIALRKQYDKYSQCVNEIEEYIQFILDQWDLDTKEAQDKAIYLLDKIKQTKGEDNV